MESLRKLGQSISQRNKKSIMNLHSASACSVYILDEISLPVSTIKNMVPRDIHYGDDSKKLDRTEGKIIIGDILTKYLGLEIDSPTKVSEIISSIQKSDLDIKLLKVGDIPYPDGMTSDITEIIEDNSSRSRVFSNLLSEGELTEGEFTELIEKMKEVRSITDIAMNVGIRPEGRSLYITLYETKLISRKGPFMDKVTVMKLSVPF